MGMNHSSFESALESSSAISETEINPNSAENLAAAANSANSLNLSQIQISQIRKMWRQARLMGADEPARSILVAVFIKAPEVQQIFNEVSNFNSNSKNSEENSQKNFEFSAHARRFLKIIEIVLNNLEKLEKIEKILVELGRKHFSARGKGFLPKYWDIFAECMIQRSLNWGQRSQKTPDTLKTWTKIVMFIIEKMKEGNFLINLIN